MFTLSQVRSSRNVLFWSLHTCGWVVYALTVYFGCLFYKPPSGIGPAIAIAAAGGFVLSAPMRYIYRGVWGRRERWVIPVVPATSYVTALALLERALLRHQVLRVEAAAAGGGAEGGDSGPGGAAQDAALPAQSTLSLQHPQRHLHSHPRQPESHGEPCGHAPLGVP